MKIRQLPFLAALSWPMAALATDVTDVPEGLYFHHHDWIVACDNTLTCRAAGSAGNSDSTLSVLLTRAGGPNQSIIGQISLKPIDSQPHPEGPLSLRVQQRDLGVLATVKETGIHLLSLKQTAALLSALVRGGDIAVADTAGHAWPLSDKGAAAVLLKLDEYQGRLGTPGAVMRKGTKAESSVPAGLPTPLVRRAPTLAAPLDDSALEMLAASPTLRAALRAPGNEPACEGLLKADPDLPISNSPLTIQRLDAKHLVVSVPCWRAAHNSGDGYWVIHEQPPYRPVRVTGDAYLYEDGQILAALRGLGPIDCISEYRWTWNGAEFVLTSAVVGVMCRHVLDGTWQLPTRISEVR